MKYPILQQCHLQWFIFTIFVAKGMLVLFLSYINIKFVEIKKTFTLCISKAFTNITSRDAVITNRGRGGCSKGGDRGIGWQLSHQAAANTPPTHTQRSCTAQAVITPEFKFRTIYTTLYCDWGGCRLYKEGGERNSSSMRELYWGRKGEIKKIYTQLSLSLSLLWEKYTMKER